MSSKKGDARSTVPKAVVHKKILDAAAENPAASVEELTDEVAGASMALVERVLDEYGDPAADDDASGQGVDDAADQGDDDTGEGSVETESHAETGESSTEVPAATEAAGDGEPAADATGGEPDDDDGGPTDAAADASGAGDASTDGEMSDSSTTPTTDETIELTEKQRRLLARIRERPAATQQDLAETFDVSQATVSNHLNAISGFEWGDRRAFADRVLDDATDDEASVPDEPGAQTESADDVAAAPRTVAQGDAAVESPAPRVDDELDAIAATVERVDDRLDDRADAAEDLAADLDALDDRLDRVEERFGGVEERVETVTGQVDAVADRFDAVEAELDGREDLADAVDRLEDRLDDLATAVERVEAEHATDGGDVATADGGGGRPGTVAFGDAALASKVMRACLNDDAITDEEEVAILESIVAAGDP